MNFASTGVSNCRSGPRPGEGDAEVAWLIAPGDGSGDAERWAILGSITLKQTDYGITPVKIAGGAVRVKDGIVIEFQVATR